MIIPGFTVRRLGRSFRKNGLSLPDNSRLPLSYSQRVRHDLDPLKVDRVSKYGIRFEPWKSTSFIPVESLWRRPLIDGFPVRQPAASEDQNVVSPARATASDGLRPSKSPSESNGQPSHMIQSSKNATVANPGKREQGTPESNCMVQPLLSSFVENSSRI
jgi:hypothetical protein